VRNDGAGLSSVFAYCGHVAEHPPAVGSSLGRQLAQRSSDSHAGDLGVLGVDGGHDATHHPPSALGDVTLALPDGVDRGDASALKYDQKLFPFQGLAGQATLVVGDDLVDVTAAQSVEQGLPLRTRHRRVGS
jgi:hypothetical protein